MKICSKCGEEKDESLFRKDRNLCKVCSHKQQKEYREEKRDKINARKREHYQENKERIGITQKAYYAKPENKEHRIKHAKGYREENKDVLSEKAKVRYDNADPVERTRKNKIWREDNREEIIRKNKIWQEENKESQIEKRKLYYWENREELLEKNKVWYQKKREEYFAEHGHYPPVKTDNNMLYIWEAVGESWNDMPIFKIGMTSERLGEQRIHSVARKANMTAKLLLLIQVGDEKASSLEWRIHNMLETTPDVGDIDGKTEFRACTYEQMETIIEMIEFDELLCA